MMQPELPWYLQEDIVKSYESWYEGKGKRADILEKHLLKELLNHIGNVSSLLEVGAGTAHFTRWFESLGVRCIGLDFSPLMLREARKIWKGQLVRGDAHNLPFRDKTFDLVALITCMEYMPNPAYVLKEAGRVARQGILWGILNKWSLPTIRRRLQVMVGRNPFYRNARFYSILDAKRLLREAFDRISYRMMWSTTVYPRMLLVRRSKLPFGAFLGVALRFNSLVGR